MPDSNQENLNMKRSDAQVLAQLIDNLSIAVARLEQNYNKKDYDNFKKTKKYILEIQKRVGELSRYNG